MAQLGADVEQLDSLSKKFDAEAQMIAQATQQISAQVNSTWWKGPDADKFRSEWNGQHVAALAKVSQALQEAGKQASRNATEQESASR